MKVDAVPLHVLAAFGLGCALLGFLLGWRERDVEANRLQEYVRVKNAAVGIRD